MRPVLGSLCHVYWRQGGDAEEVGQTWGVTGTLTWYNLPEVGEHLYSNLVFGVCCTGVTGIAADFNTLYCLPSDPCKYSYREETPYSVFFPVDRI